MKILVADDHPLVRGGLKTVLQDLSDDVQILEAVDFPQVLDVIEEHPDVTIVLLDLNMPGSDGMSGLRALQENQPALPVVVLSGSEDPKDVRGALDNGAAGYIPKSSNTTVMISAINLVLSGGVYVPPTLLRADDSGDGLGGNADATAGKGAIDALTDRQQEVLALMRQGKSNKEIARDLDIAESTVKAHVSVILKTLNVSSRAKAILAADELYT